MSNPLKLTPKRYKTSAPPQLTTLITLILVALTLTGCESKLKSFLDSQRPKPKTPPPKVEPVAKLPTPEKTPPPLPEKTSADLEPNDSRDQANPILLTSENRPISGLLTNSHDTDWFKISADVDQPAYINLHSSAPNANLKLTLHSYDGTPLRTLTSNSSNNPTKLLNLGIVRKPTYISISPADDNIPPEGTPYHLEFFRHLSKDLFEQEPNDRAVLATQLRVPSTIQGHFDSPDDLDIFKIVPKTKEISTLTVKAPENSALKIELQSLIPETDSDLSTHGDTLLTATLAPNQELNIPSLDLAYRSHQPSQEKQIILPGVLLKLTPSGDFSAPEDPYTVTVGDAAAQEANPNIDPQVTQMQELEPNDLVAQFLTDSAVQISGTLYTPSDVDTFRWQPDGYLQKPTVVDVAPTPTPADTKPPEKAPKKGKSKPPKAPTTDKSVGENGDWGVVPDKPRPQPIYSAILTPAQENASMTLTWQDGERLETTATTSGGSVEVCGRTLNDGSYQLEVSLASLKTQEDAPILPFSPLSYLLTVKRFDNGRQESEPNDTFETADRLLLDQERFGYLPSENNLDFWAFQVPVAPPEPVKSIDEVEEEDEDLPSVDSIDVVAAGGQPVPAPQPKKKGPPSAKVENEHRFRHVVITANSLGHDLALFVVDKNGATLALINNEGFAKPEKVELDLPPALYFVKVSTKKGGCQPYDLKVSIQE